MKETFKTSHLPLTLTKLEKSVAENNCEEGWIYGSKVVYTACIALVLHSGYFSVRVPRSNVHRLLHYCVHNTDHYTISSPSPEGDICRLCCVCVTGDSGDRLSVSSRQLSVS